MNKEFIKINDFELFFDIIKYLKSMSDGIKFTINNCGLSVYAKNEYSKCEMTSNSIMSDNDISFCIGDLDKFLKMMTTVKEIHKNYGYDSLKFFFASPFVCFESKYIKSKINTSEEDKIINFLGTKIHTELTPQIEFTTGTSFIKTILCHSYLFDSSTTPRIYLMEDKDMENNVLYAKVGNNENDLDNSIVLKLGLINSGSIGNRTVILDFKRLNILNMVPSEDINVWLSAEKPVLVSNIKKEGKNSTFFNLNIYSFLMVK